MNRKEHRKGYRRKRTEDNYNYVTLLTPCNICLSPLHSRLNAPSLRFLLHWYVSLRLRLITLKRARNGLYGHLCVYFVMYSPFHSILSHFSFVLEAIGLERVR